MNKRFVFIAGLPRAGSTLLANVLAQNPRFHATSTSGILDLIFNVRNVWDKLAEFQASPNDPAKLRVMRGMLDAYHADADRPVVFDKSRGWLAHLEMATAILGHRPKVLVPVRDLRDVLASFEKLWRATSATAQVSHEAADYIAFQSVQGRCTYWMRGDQPVGLAYQRIADAIQRGWGDCMHFIDFDHLTARPGAALADVYAFLGEPPHRHDVDRVEQMTFENDAVHGFKGLHAIRPKIEPVPSQWQSVIGPAANTWHGTYVWEPLVAARRGQAPHVGE